MKTAGSLLDHSLARPRHLAIILGGFSLLALVLAVIGLYGITAYSVQRRRSVIAIRIALGGTPRSVLTAVLRQGMTLVVVGLALGVVSALGVTRVLSGLLYGVAPTDGSTLVAVSALLATVALVASWLPARSAARVDPATILLVLASTTERDIVSIALPGRTEESEMRWTRAWVGIFALITALISLRPLAGIVELTAFSGSLYGACFFPAIVFGLHWRRGSGTAVIASFVVGILVLLAWDFVPGSQILHKIFPAMALSTGAFWSVSVLTENGASEEVEALLAGDPEHQFQDEF